MKSITQAVQERRKEADAAACERFITKWIKKFKKGCHKCAELGHAEASMQLDADKMLFLGDNIALEQVAERVADRLRDMGGMVEVMGPVSRRTRITAFWDQAAPPQPARKKRCRSPPWAAARSAWRRSLWWHWCRAAT